MKSGLKLSLVILWAAIIFYFSSQSGSESSQTSQFVVQFLNTFGININSIFGNIASTLIRKGAHFLEYFILALFCFNYLKDKYNVGLTSRITIIFCFVYASSDEIHQYFVPNRGSSVIDVLIDTLGAITAIVFIQIIRYIRNRHVKKET